MADISQISGQIAAQIQGKVTGKALVPSETKPEGYRKADQAKTFAQAYQSRDSAETQKGLLRLNQVMDKDQPLNQDVPRGFYLNIKV
jgi:hypothetical protein